MTQGNLLSTTTSVLFTQELILPRCALEVVEGPDLGNRAQLEGGRVVVGTAPDSAIPLSDPHVSREHFAIERTAEGYRLKDLNSTNGTRIGPVRIIEALLTEPTLISLGNTTIQFTAKDESIPVAPYEKGRLDTMIGHSQEMRLLFGAIRRLAQLKSEVLLLGETGTGKELAAQALHQQSPWSQGPFVAVNCAAIPSTLFEAELFGYVKGAFTGAVKDHQGAFQRAHGGTLFLDEIAELPLSQQAKLLRVLETKQVQPLGCHTSHEVDFRLVSATHRHLGQERQDGQFRDDLFYRLAVIELELPPLREHKADLGPLIAHFLHQFAQENPDQPRRKLVPEAKQAFSVYDWPGNIRELRNAVFSAASLTPDGLITTEHLPARLKPKGAKATDELLRTEIDPHFVMPDILPFKEEKEACVMRFEREYLTNLLRACVSEGKPNKRPNISEASRKSGLDRKYIYRLMEKHGLSN